MVRKRRKKSLYEVIGQTWPKSRRDETLEQPHPERRGEKAEPAAAESTTPVPERCVRWPKRPRIVQLNADRIEISIPYQLAIAILLGIILLVLIVFRLGQSSQKESGSTSEIPKNTRKPVPAATVGIPQMSVQAERKTPTPASAKKVEPVNPKGNNRIVIQTYQRRAHLEPVKQYFARFGIETEIKKMDGWYYLVTRDKYENPEKPGTDGYIAKQKIIERGSKYKAPPGYETFGTKPFHDAYGMRFED